nr:hypothetical protein TorRG33x02_018220 [Ipomoea batatas]
MKLQIPANHRAAQSISPDGYLSRMIFSHSNNVISDSGEGAAPTPEEDSVLTFQAPANGFQLCDDGGVQRLEPFDAVAENAPKVWGIQPRILSSQLVSRLVVSHGGFYRRVEGSQPQPGSVFRQPDFGYPFPPMPLSHPPVKLPGLLGLLHRDCFPAQEGFLLILKQKQLKPLLPAVYVGVQSEFGFQESEIEKVGSAQSDLIVQIPHSQTHPKTFGLLLLYTSIAAAMAYKQILTDQTKTAVENITYRHGVQVKKKSKNQKRPERI